MKLYHATPADNVGSIIEGGLWPNSTDAPTRSLGDYDGDTLQMRGLNGIYAWVSLDDAVDFARYECSGWGVVFEIEADGFNVIDDPEFEGAKFIITDRPIPAAPVWDQYGVYVERKGW